MNDGPRKFRGMLLCLLNFRDRELAVHPVGLELHLVASLDLLEHGGVLGAEDHRVTLVEVELLDWAVLDRDLAGGFIDLGHLTVDQSGLRERRARQLCDHKSEHARCNDCHLAHETFPFFSGFRNYFTTTWPTMPFS